MDSVESRWPTPELTGGNNLAGAPGSRCEAGLSACRRQPAEEALQPAYSRRILVVLLFGAVEVAGAEDWQAEIGARDYDVDFEGFFGSCRLSAAPPPVGASCVARATSSALM